MELLKPLKSQSHFPVFESNFIFILPTKDTSPNYSESQKLWKQLSSLMSPLHFLMEVLGDAGISLAQAQQLKSQCCVPPLNTGDDCWHLLVDWGGMFGREWHGQGPG